ncbi:MAG: cytochrome c oxidase subunit 3 [Acidobacteriota bacterium]|jgi:cytochrome c oxidase subunit 3
MAEAAATTQDRWAGGVCPFDAGWQKVMMWMFIVTDGLLFAAFLAAYGYMRFMSDSWPDQKEVFSIPFIAAMTFVLISSSATMASAVASARHGDRSKVGRFLLMTIVGGAIFLGMQAFEWTHLIEEGARLWGNPWGDPMFGAYFFLITGFHGTHVLSGVIILAILWMRWTKGVATPTGVEMGGLYWHFVDLVWVFVFTCFYLL